MKSFARGPPESPVRFLSGQMISMTCHLQVRLMRSMHLSGLPACTPLERKTPWPKDRNAAIGSRKNQPAYPLSSADSPWQTRRKLIDGEGIAMARNRVQFQKG